MTGLMASVLAMGLLGLLFISREIVRNGPLLWN